MFGYSLVGNAIYRAGKVMRVYASRGDAVSAFAKIIRYARIFTV